MKRYLLPTLAAAVAVLLVAEPAFAQEAANYTGLGRGIGIGFAVLGGGIGQGLAAKGAVEGIARNPNAQGKVLVPMVLGLALIESLVLIAFLIAGGIVG